jgi:MFS transporter, FSR family, fosmidomycin resistance protein
MNPSDMDRRALIILSVSHMFNDVSQGSIPALLPFLVADRSLSYVAASGVVLAATAVSSLIQPLLGYYSDRHPIPWLMPAGVIAGGIGIALVGIAPTYWLILASVLLSGAGVAAFHPEGSRFANYVSGQRATGMSYFTVGGTVGFALGPVMITPLVLGFGLAGTLAMLLPAALVAIVLARELPRLATFRPELKARTSGEPGSEDKWGAFSRLTGVIALRTALYFGLMTFVPLYYIKWRHASVAEGNAALTVMLLSGAAGTIVSGFLGDRFGLKRVLVSSLWAIPPLLLAFLGTNGPVALLCLGLVGITTIGSSTVAVVMGQSYLRSHIGVASGITLGLAIGIGGLAVPVLGFVADHYGLTTTMYSMIALPVAAAGVAHTLPPS